MLVTFSHNGLKRFLSHTCQKVSLCGNGLNGKIFFNRVEKTDVFKGPLF